MSTTMHAMVLIGHGGPDKLVYRTDFPKPAPAVGEALIKIGACGLNNTDINTRTAWYSKAVTGATSGEAQKTADTQDATWGGSAITFPRIQGGDICGTVEAVGKEADTNLVGRRVLVDPCLRNPSAPTDIDRYRYLGSETNGGFAEYAVVPAHQAHPIDSPHSDAELATFPIAYLTAENMLNRACVKESDTVLVTGASGGVGSALIQLAKRRGARVIGLCGEEKQAMVREIGAETTIPRNTENLAEAIKKATGQATVSVVADVVGGSVFPALMEILQRGGRYTCAGAIAGPIVEMDLRTFYLRDLTLTGATFSPLGTFADIVAYIERGEIRPLLTAAYPLRELHQAQKAFTEKKFFGNIVVQPE